MTSIATSALLDQIRQRLSPLRRDTLNVLATSTNTSVTSIVMTYDQGVAPNAKVSIGLEDMMAFSATASSKTFSPVSRGFNSSTAASHTAADIVYINAEFSAWDMLRAVNETLAALPGEGVWKPTTVDLTGSASKVGYDLTSVGNILAGHRVRYKELGGFSNWVTIPRSAWEIKQGMPTSEFASAEALMVYVYVAPGQTLELLYRAPFTALSALTDDVETISGLPASMHALLVVGAVLRLTQGRPTERASTSAQGDTRRPSEVTTNDTRLAASPLELEWQRGLKRARLELKRRHGA